MRLGQVLAVGALALVEVGHGVEAQPVDAQRRARSRRRRAGPRRTRGVVEVEVGLVGVEAVPVVGAGDRVPGPVGGLEVLEDDARVAVALRACRSRRRSRAAADPGGARRARWNQGCWSEVWLSTSSVMTRRPRRWASRMKRAKVAQRAVVGVDARVVGDVVAVVAQRRGVERQQPDGGDAEVVQVVELARSGPRKSPMPSPLLSQKARTCSS